LDRLSCTVYRRGRENVFNGLPNCFNCSWTRAVRHSDLCRSQKWDKGIGERLSRHRIARHLRGLPDDRDPQLRVLTQMPGSRSATVARHVIRGRHPSHRKKPKYQLIRHTRLQGYNRPHDAFRSRFRSSKSELAYLAAATLASGTNPICRGRSDVVDRGRPEGPCPGQSGAINPQRAFELCEDSSLKSEVAGPQQVFVGWPKTAFRHVILCASWET
jgi:hypothetical protein